MIVLCVMNCPPSLRGDLSKWLNEVNTGVYVGKLNARVREELWLRVCGNIKNGQATMVYSTNNEQGYAFLVHNTTWIPVDYEGITLMQKPLSLKEDNGQGSFLEQGFSKAAKYEKIRQSHSMKKEDFVVLNIQKTEADNSQDRIIDIGMLKIKENEIIQQYDYLIRSEKNVPDNVRRLAGITNELVESQEGQVENALDKLNEFIDNNLIIGYDLQDTMSFLQKLGKQTGRSIQIKKVKDIMHIAKRKLDDVENYRLETVASYFSLTESNKYRALACCRLIYKIYCELNKI